MQSWEEYIKSNILKFREMYAELDPKIRQKVEESKFVYGNKLCKPCQVLLITYSGFSDVFLVVVNSKKMADKTIIVKENVDFEGFWEKDENRKLSKTFGVFYPNNLRPSNPSGVSASWSANLVTLHLPEDPRYKINQIAEYFFKNIRSEISFIKREKQSKKIESTVEDIKRAVEAIPETVQLKKKIIDNTKRLEKQIEQQNKKFEEDFSALREMVGTDEHIGWKGFCSDIKHLKDTHLEREVFDAHIKRLDEKIERGIESLNTRIEDLKAIKFWSKRTFLEIALFIWGAILTLYVAGIIKF